MGNNNNSNKQAEAFLLDLGRRINSVTGADSGIAFLFQRISDAICCFRAALSW